MFWDGVCQQRKVSSLVVTLMNATEKVTYSLLVMLAKIFRRATKLFTLHGGNMRKLLVDFRQSCGTIVYVSSSFLKGLT